MQFAKFKDDLEQTWQTIKTILRDKPPDSTISQLTNLLCTFRHTSSPWNIHL